MTGTTPGIAMRQLAVDRLDELGKAMDLARKHGVEFECGLVSALRLAGVELPLIPRGALNLDRLHIVVDVPAGRRSWKGAEWHVAAPSLLAVGSGFRREYSPMVVMEGIRMTHPLLAWAQMSRFIDETELTALADSMMRRNQSEPHFVPDDFRTLVEVLPKRFKGRTKCLWALDHMRENTDSSMETRMRLKLEAEPLPELRSLTVNHKVAVDEDGASMYLDMALPDLRIGIEYAGRHHAGQWSDDVSRQSALTAVGWEILTAHNDTLKDPLQWKEFMVRLASLAMHQRQRSDVGV
ncbi:hypothetical protein [Bifidobacterium platyrrhinorum]|uniref:DUF559 domain-containing protein n=1 Tax=Bifidobacterium platyrrhinorum TaxID=2661628 RepID=A0A6L9SS14_9BIFI|nr:hypothetical protein [Bifidobacterium platyrrhinorum]NEG54839.1 hypothetical protein [Bifidobacterium platyrrhinorum]